MQRDTIRSDAMLQNVSENNNLIFVFESPLGAPFGSPFSVPLESILRLSFGPVRAPFWSSESDLEMDRAARVGTLPH